jgi:NADPH-dependent 2,4-dienoyl-CoA reductase/sulfur reductase-like enzyme/rhodanese-related sulfurtransferase
MGQQVIIVGAVAAGPKAACRIKRLDPSAHITLIDRDNFISYAGCGIPYFVGGDVADLEGLQSTFAHVVRDCNYFQDVKGVDVRPQVEAVLVDCKAKQVVIRNLMEGREETLSYDKLVLATGSSPMVPDLPGMDLPGVFSVKNLHHAREIKDRVSKGMVESAVVIGGGAKGLEMAEALTDLWGVETTLIEIKDQLVESAFGKDMALLIQNHLQEKDVRVVLSEQVIRIVGDTENGVEAVETETQRISCELVIITAGTKPNVSLARNAGLAIGETGAIVVNEYMQTSDPDIYAGGDCVEITHLVSGRKIHMPVGSLANLHGRVIGTNIAGGLDRFPGTVASCCLKVFDMAVARAGLTVKQAENDGFDPVFTIVVQSDRAHFYPTQELMWMKLIADRKSRKILGIEVMGSQGDAVKSRADVVGALLVNQLDLSVLSNLEVGHTPPFAASLDIINNAANSLENILEGRQDSINVGDFLKLFKEGKARVLDVRSAVQAGPFVEKYGNQWINIPQEDLPHRLQDIPSETLSLVCGSGPRSYEAQLFLREKGYKETKNVQGGIGMIKYSDPDFSPSEH